MGTPKEQIYSEMVGELLARRNSLRARRKVFESATTAMADIDARLEVIEEELAAYGHKDPPPAPVESIVRNG